jgi:hypothetical protein
MMPATPSVADAVAESRRLLKRAEEFSNYTDERGQASAQMATGHVLLAIGEEIATMRAQLDQLAGIRHEVASLAGAVRELTATITKAAEVLPDIANAVSDLPDPHEGLSNIAMAVECLVPYPSRWAFWRRRHPRPNLSPEVSA